MVMICYWIQLCVYYIYKSLSLACTLAILSISSCLETQVDRFHIQPHELSSHWLRFHPITSSPFAPHKVFVVLEYLLSFSFLTFCPFPKGLTDRDRVRERAVTDRDKQELRETDRMDRVYRDRQGRKGRAGQEQLFRHKYIKKRPKLCLVQILFYFIRYFEGHPWKLNSWSMLWN